MWYRCQVTTTTPNNTPRAVAKEDGSIIWSWESKPFGETKPNEDPDSDGNSFTLNLRFPGQYADSESGLYYNFNRYYSPKLGRYITSDPIGFEGGVNTYLYAGADPVGKVDKNGLDIEYDDKYKPIIDKIINTEIGWKLYETLEYSNNTYKIKDTGKFFSRNEYLPESRTIDLSYDATWSVRVKDKDAWFIKTKCIEIKADNILVHEMGHAYLHETQGIDYGGYRIEMYVIENFENPYGGYERVDHDSCFLF